MAEFSYTYTLTNGTAADADQVMQNFNDVRNGVVDGSKDIDVSALAVAGAATFGGAVTLGNASNDDITLTGSLASSIPIKTTFTYDIGANTLGLRDIYLGSADGAARSTKIRGATIASAWTLTLPTVAGTSGFTWESNGSGTTTWVPKNESSDILNLSLTATVAANALTIAVKTAAGSDATSADPVYVAFRNVTSATGTTLVRSITGALSLVVSSGSTLGNVSAVAECNYIYLIDNAGTLELAICGGAQMFDDGTVVTSTAEGGAGGADTRYTLYSTTARTSVPARLIGRIKSTQTTAGTWATAISEISLVPFEWGRKAENSVVVVHTGNGHGSSNTCIRRFTTIQTNTGTAITYADSAGNGGSFTINEEGLYYMSYSDDDGTGGRSLGVTLNGTELSTNIASLGTPSQRLAMVNATTGGNPAQCSGAWRLKPGDIIRAHTGGTMTGTSTYDRFQIIKISS